MLLVCVCFCLSLAHYNTLLYYTLCLNYSNLSVCLSHTHHTHIFTTYKKTKIAEHANTHSKCFTHKHTHNTHANTHSKCCTRIFTQNLSSLGRLWAYLIFVAFFWQITLSLPFVRYCCLLIIKSLS